tara:strand:- start:379 stop:945 length:567 start_codon:yes stop_codon:yes gene_type:complete
MDIKKFSLFPTLVLSFPNFISSKDCNKIFKLLKTKKRHAHAAFIKGKSNHSSYVHTDILSDLSISLNKPLEEYADQTKIKIDNKIRNSWFNIQDKESILKDHVHPDSVLSGAIFINVGKKASKLYFHNPNPFSYFTPKNEPLNEYTYEWCCFNPCKGDLIIFPSWLKHGSNQDKNFYNNRTVISFNAF